MNIIDTVTRLLHKYGKIVFLILLFAVMGMQFFISTNMKALPEHNIVVKAKKTVPLKKNKKVFKSEEYRVVRKLEAYEFQGQRLYWERFSTKPVVRPWILLYDGRTKPYRDKLSNLIWSLIFIFCISSGIIVEAGYATKDYCSYGQSYTFKTCSLLLGSIGLFLLLTLMVILIVY